jgi:hypothetical protein
MCVFGGGGEDREQIGLLIQGQCRQLTWSFINPELIQLKIL